MTDQPNDKRSETIPLEVRSQLAHGLTGLLTEPVFDKPVLTNDLVQYVQGKSRYAERVEQAIGNNLPLRRQYQGLLEACSTMRAGRLRAAASTDTISSREGEHFRIHWVQPQDLKDQVYIVLELEPSAGRTDGDALVLHVYTGTKTTSRNFPGLFDGRSQIIVESTDKLLELLNNEDSEIRIV